MRVENGVNVDITKCNYPKNEEPVVVMRYKKRLIIIGQLGILLCFWFFSFGTIIPYITTGDFAEIWPSHVGSTGTKAAFFYVSWLFWIYSPTTIQIFRGGDVTFFETYVEVRPFLGFLKNRTIMFDVMHAKKRGDRGIVLTNGNPGKLLSTPYNYWKTVYWQGIGVTMCEIGLRNPECLSTVSQIINRQAKDITEF